MTEILSNTQSQQYTTSNYGRNVRAALVANSHFFVESGEANGFNQNAFQKLELLLKLFVFNHIQLIYNQEKNVLFYKY